MMCVVLRVARMAGVSGAAGVARVGLRCMRRSSPSFSCPPQIQMYSSNEVIKWSKQEPDPLLESIRQSSSPEQLLAAVQRHLPALSAPHTLLVLHTLFTLTKQHDRTESATANIIRSGAFASLGHTLRRHAPALAPPELVRALKALCYLRVPPDALLVQTLLQLVRDNLGRFDVRQIMFLDFLLSKYDTPSHLVDALKLALPLAFQLQVQLEMDGEEWALLRDMLAYACHRRLPERCVNNLVTALVLHERATAMDVQSARAVAWALCQVECEGQAGRARLLRLSLDALAPSLRALPFAAAWQLARRLAARVQAGRELYYHGALLDAVAEYAVAEHADLHAALNVATLFNKINHLSRPLAEHLARVALEGRAAADGDGHGEGTQLEGARPPQLVQLVRYLSNVRAPAPAPPALQRALAARARHYLERDTTILWPRFALEMASLGVYDAQVVRALCDEAWLRRALPPDQEGALDHMQLLLLAEAARTFRPELGAALPAAVAARARHLYPVRAQHPALHAALCDALGGPSLLVPNLTLPSGIVIDYAIFVKDGAPLPLPHDAAGKNYLGDLDAPPDADMLCVVVVGARDARGAGDAGGAEQQLRGKEQLLLALVAAQAGPAMPLALRPLLALPGPQRAPRLRRDLTHLAHTHRVELALPAAPDSAAGAAGAASSDAETSPHPAHEGPPRARHVPST